MTPHVGEQALASILRPLRKSQQKIVLLVAQAIAFMGQAACIPIAAYLSHAAAIQLDSALSRLYRLLHNPRLDDLLLARQMLSVLSTNTNRLLVALDWTEWHSNLRLLLASVAVGKRAIPVYVAAFVKTNIRRSQNTWENNFLKILVLLLNEIGKTACFLADRGFRRVSFVKLLLEQTGHEFLVRLQDKVCVRTKKGNLTLRRQGLQPGQALDLGWVKLRQDGAVLVRVVGIWAKGLREPWWIATNLDEPLSKIAALYDRRMAIEEQIRDTKGARFGLGLVWTQIETTSALARFVMLIGLAMILMTAAGNLLSEKRPDFRLTSKKKGHRLSLVTIARIFLPLLASDFQVSLNFLHRNIPPPSLRSFDWLEKLNPIERRE